jgi:hypothetical protein
MYAIYTDANEDNVEVGEAIGRKVNEAAESGMNLLQIVQEEVDAKNLTVELAKLHLGQLLVRKKAIFCEKKIILISYSCNVGCLY